MGLYILLKQPINMSACLLFCELAVRKVHEPNYPPAVTAVVPS